MLLFNLVFQRQKNEPDFSNVEREQYQRRADQRDFQDVDREPSCSNGDNQPTWFTTR
ncbi:hypothetical protein VCR14J2_230072 [Vibrio coralliirubri]|nr:hypothetical protein VCR14J2_230072 [Vibrio coralliirubri]